MMKKIVILSMLLFVGCATVGRQYDASAVEKIKKGETTRDEIITLFGKPISTTNFSGGKSGMTYMHASGSIGGSSQSQILTIMVDENGKVESYTSSTGGL